MIIKLYRLDKRFNMKLFLKYLKIVFLNLILITFLSQLSINGMLSNILVLNSVSRAELIEFPVPTKYTSKEEIDSIYQQNYYVPDKNPDTNINFNSNAMIGVQGWHWVREYTVSGYIGQSWGYKQGEFREKLGDSIQTDGGVCYVMDGADKCYIQATGQAFGVVGDRINFKYKNLDNGEELVINTVMQDAKAPDDWYASLGWFPEGPYGWYADLWGLNTIEFCGADSLPWTMGTDMSRFGGSSTGHWVLIEVDNQGGFQGFENPNQRVSKDVAWPGAASSTTKYDIDADYVDLDVREFKFSGIPKTVSYEGYTNPIANLFKNLGRALDMLMGLLINGLKRVIIGWTRIIEIMVNYVFYKTEQTIVEAPGDDSGE